MSTGYAYKIPQRKFSINWHLCLFFYPLNISNHKEDWSAASLKILNNYNFKSVKKYRKNHVVNYGSHFFIIDNVTEYFG